MRNQQIENKIEEIELKIQAILEPYFVVLDGRCNEAANDTIIEISKKIIEKIYFKDLQQTKEEAIKECIKEVEKIKTEYLIRSQGVESEGNYINKIDLITKLNNLK